MVVCAFCAGPLFGGATGRLCSGRRADLHPEDEVCPTTKLKGNFLLPFWQDLATGSAVQ